MGKHIMSNKIDNICNINLDIMIVIELEDHVTVKKVGNQIYNQLKGNPDYVGSAILLNLSDEDSNEHEVRLYFFKDRITTPLIALSYLDIRSCRIRVNTSSEKEFIMRVDRYWQQLVTMGDKHFISINTSNTTDEVDFENEIIVTMNLKPDLSTHHVDMFIL